MIYWRGTGEIHVTYQPRKPTQYGIELKTMACAVSSIMLMVELAEGKARDAMKQYRDQVGASTATTLRLTSCYKGTGRVVIADSWFGSCQTAEWLMDEHGLYAILAIKTGHRGFPKRQMIDAVRGERYSKRFMKCTVALEVGETQFFAGAFMDKVPLLLLGSCGTSLDGEPTKRDRVEFTSDGGFTRTSYTVTQPGMHDTYRRHFNGVDLFNRDCFGDLTLQHAIRTKSWSRRMFLALLGMCEVNAMNAYRMTVGPMERYAWLQ